jgi:hypothetical protein
MTSSTESRRAFLRGVLGTGAAALAVSACQLQVAGAGAGEPGGVPYQAGVVEPAEVVPLRPGVHYEAAMPARVAAVRTLPSARSMYEN